MKSKWIWLAGALALVIFIAGAYILYDQFGSEYRPDNLVVNTTEATTHSETTAPLDTADSTASTGYETTADTSGEHTHDYTAPDFTVMDVDGNKVMLSDFKGKPVVLNFWATWCPYCVAEMPAFEEMYHEYGDRVQFMIVNCTDDRETVAVAKEHIAENGYTFPVFFDTEMEATHAYGAYSLPVTYFIDANGILIAYAKGMLDEETMKQGIGMILE